jgi:hypothetical protein
LQAVQDDRPIGTEAENEYDSDTHGRIESDSEEEADDDPVDNAEDEAFEVDEDAPAQSVAFEIDPDINIDSKALRDTIADSLVTSEPAAPLSTTAAASGSSSDAPIN